MLDSYAILKYHPDLSTRNLNLLVNTKATALTGGFSWVLSGELVIAEYPRAEI